MKSVLREELKKIFKSKINCLLILTMIFVPWYFAYQIYQDGLYLRSKMSGNAIEISKRSELEMMQEVDQKCMLMRA